MKNKVLLTIGGILFVTGMILFPLPVPFGLPVMMISLAMMLKASFKVKRIVIHLSDKNESTRKTWQITRNLLRRKKNQRQDKRSGNK